jgi:mannosyltransferase
MAPLESSNSNVGSSSVPRFSDTARRVAIGLLLAVAVAVRLFCLACKPFWFDECFSVQVARLDWRNFLHLMWWREANMSLYYLILRAWLHFGQRPFIIRSLSVLISVATTSAVYWLARSLYNRRVALIASALLTMNAYAVRYAQEARSYSLFVLLATLSAGFLISWLRQPTRRALAGYVVTSCLVMYAHFYALLLLAAQWLAVLGMSSFEVAGQPERRGNALRQAWMIIGTAILPLLIFVGKTGAGPIRWILRPGVRDVFRLFEYFAGGRNWIALAVLAVACLAALRESGKDLLKRARNWETWRCQFLLIWILFPVALTVLLSFARPVFLARYMIFCLPAFLILASAGMARLRQWWQLGLVLLAVVLLGAQGTAFVYAHDFDTERDASGTATDFILDHSQPSDAIVFHIAATRIPYEFFRSLRAGENTASPTFTGRLGPEIVFPRHGAGLQYEDFTGKPTPELLHAIGEKYPRVWVMLMNNGSAENPDPATIMLTQALSESLPKVNHWGFARVEVRLYSKE